MTGGPSPSRAKVSGVFGAPEVQRQEEEGTTSRGAEGDCPPYNCSLPGPDTASKTVRQPYCPVGLV